MNRSSKVLKRLDLQKEIIDEAKWAYARARNLKTDDLTLEDIFFREMLDYAVQTYLPGIVKVLCEHGFRSRQPDTKRTRWISQSTWEEVGRLAEEELDTSRISLIRACLQMLASSSPGGKGSAVEPRKGAKTKRKLRGTSMENS